MKKTLLALTVVLVIGLASCTKECTKCIGGKLDDREICKKDGYGEMAVKMFIQNCKAGEGSTN